MPNSPITFAPTPGMLSSADLMFGPGMSDLTASPNLSGLSVPRIGAPDAATGALSGVGSGVGFNVPTINMALGGLQTIGNLWGAFQAAKMAKKQFGFQKEYANANLANSIQSYNTQLDDKARSRAVVESQTPDQMKAYVDANSLKYKPL